MTRDDIETMLDKAIGRRPRYERWLAMWALIGTTVVLQHNLMVLVQSESADVRRAAAFEVATVIMAVGAALL